MKTGLVLLLIFDVFKSGKSEFRHHQQDRYFKENITAYPWSSTTGLKIIEEDKRVTELTRQEWSVTLADGKEKSRGLPKPSEMHRRSGSGGSYRSNPTTASFLFDKDSERGRRGGGSGGGRGRKGGRGGGNPEEILLLKRKNLEILKITSKFLQVENSTKSFGVGSSNVHVSTPSYKKRENNEEGTADMSNEILFRKNSSARGDIGKKKQVAEEENNPLPKDAARDSAAVSRRNKAGRDVVSDVPFAESLVALTNADDSGDCVESVVRDFSISDDLVTRDVLTVRNEAENLAIFLGRTDGALEEMTDIMESTMEKHPRITSISVRVLKRKEKWRASRTVYRKGKDLLIDGQWQEYPDFSTEWTPLFRSCLTNTWIFGYSFNTEDENRRIDSAVYFSADSFNGTIDQCESAFREILDGGPKCEATTTQCAPVPHSGFKLGGYKCACREGFYFPDNVRPLDDHLGGFDIEKNYSDENSSYFRCIPCPESCKGSCTTSGLCVYQRNNLLINSVLSIQIFCVFTTFALTVLVFKHRKCKTIATGMWTIMEMILLGSIILYGTIIIRAFNPSTVLCLIEPWCREMGFVLCYGAIVLKLYRILIEFRTRKAHRWVIRDKDLLKYLLGMIIVVFGYMSAWTATNLYLIRKESYSMLTTGATLEGRHFNACKAVWWDYVTETGEILILIFGVHLSYASRNATTQFRERCFLCISISVEALVSGIFYVLRYFYWETTVHPDLSFVANFTRCQLTTTVVLLLLFTPKWWYQKVQINKGRVSRNYLMQESGRGPLEAFKPQDGVTATNSDIEGEISLAEMNPEDIRAELKRLYTQLEVLKNKTIRFDNPHISKRRGGRKIAHRRFSLQKKGSREKALRQQTQRLSTRHADVEVTEAEASRTPEDSVCSNEGPSIIINDGPSDIVHATPKKGQK